jgi:hypothetical protein
MKYLYEENSAMKQKIGDKESSGRLYGSASRIFPQNREAFFVHISKLLLKKTSDRIKETVK